MRVHYILTDKEGQTLGAEVCSNGIVADVSTERLKSMYRVQERYKYNFDNATIDKNGHVRGTKGGLKRKLCWKITSERFEKEYDKLHKEYRDAKITFLQFDAKTAELNNEYLKVMPADERLAILMHDTLCKENHADGCSWHYEVKGIKHDWNGSSHGEWLFRAREVLRTANDDWELAENMVLAIMGLRGWKQH